MIMKMNIFRNFLFDHEDFDHEDCVSKIIVSFYDDFEQS